MAVTRIGMKNHISLFLLLGLCIHCSVSLAQPGMYNESDIEYQTIFFEAHHAKVTGNTDEQIKLLNTLIKRDKGSHAAYWELARTYTTLGNQEKAQKNAEKATQLAPTNEWYQLTLAEIYEQSGQIGASIQTYKSLKAINPDNPTIYHKLAQLLLHEKKIDEAVGNLEALQARHGVDEESSRRIFDIYKGSGDKSKAIKAIRNLSNAFPDNTRYLNNLASYHMEIGQTKEAKKVYKEILALNPDDPTASIAIARDASSKKGSSKTEHLIPLIENMNLNLDDKIKELMPLVSTMEKTGETTLALQSMSSRLVELYPKEAKVYSLQGDILFYQSKYQEAEKSYSTAIKLDDRKYALWSQYMQTLWELEKYPALEKISMDAIDLFPNKVSAFVYQALGLSMNKKSGAADLITEAGFIAGKNKALSNQIAIVSQWLNKSDVSKDVLKNIDLKAIQDPLYYELAADLYSVVKDSSTAKKLWNKAISFGANPTRLNQKLGTE